MSTLRAIKRDRLRSFGLNQTNVRAGTKLAKITVQAQNLERSTEPMELIKRMFAEVLAKIEQDNLRGAVELATMATKCLKDQIKLLKEDTE